MNDNIDLELATLDQISEEIGKRSAYGNFFFYDGKSVLVGNKITVNDLELIQIVIKEEFYRFFK